MVPPTETASTSPVISGAARLAFYLIMGGMALLEVFVSFRGLKSPAGMEQAQLAREVARGHGWVTQCVRPGEWKQLLEGPAGAVELQRFPDTSSAPLPALLLAPLFKLAEPWWVFDPGKNGVVYALDRISASMGALFFLLTLYHLHSLALRLFDARVATVVALGTGFCKPLWELAVSGSPRVLLGLELVLGLRLVLSVLERVEKGLPVSGRLGALGLVSAAMVMTHGFGVVFAGALLVGVVMGMGRESRGTVGLTKMLMALLLPVLLLTGMWMWRNLQVTGDVLGSAKLTLRGLISGLGEEAVARRFSDASDAMAVPQVIRRSGLFLADQLNGIYGHLGLILGAPLALLAWLHRFRKSVTQVMSHLVLLILILSMVAMALTAPVNELMDEHNVFILLGPVLSVFGVAMVTMAWSRMHPGARGFMGEWGHGVILVGLSALPMVMSLPDTIRGGLVLRGRLSQWPPYAADRVARVGGLVEDKEIVMADAPWFTAWYADVTSVWMPIRRADLALIREAAQKAGHPVAGVVITPVSAKAESMVQLLNGPWADWPDVVLRGPMMAFDREMGAWPDFPYPVAVPLVGFSIGESEGLGLLMAFYTDRARRPKTAK
jgi:hypothetical protein